MLAAGWNAEQRQRKRLKSTGANRRLSLPVRIRRRSH